MPSISIQPKGLLSTEGVISIPFEGAHPLAIRSHYYEFEDDTGRTFVASDLHNDRVYSVVITNAGGLCRYRLNDQIRVTGMLGRTPSIRFIGKSGLVSDRMGEKLSDGFVATVFARLFGNYSPQPSFAMFAPHRDGDGYRYILYINVDATRELATTLDVLLSTNPQYAHCRRLAAIAGASPVSHFG